MNRRRFLAQAGFLAFAGIAGKINAENKSELKKSNPFFKTRGIVLTPDDLTWSDWLERAKKTGITTIGLHYLPETIKYIQTDSGQGFLAQCRKLNLEIEYEMHAMSELLHRELFKKSPDMFRMNKEGERIPDCNLCVHSKQAIEVVCENVTAIGKILKPTTGRYFFWIDDGKPMCFCPQCRDFSNSDQALILENHILEALHTIDLRAQLAHLAYANTLEPPQKVKPNDGVFLEFAPIGSRDKFIPKSDLSWQKEMNALDGNLKVFPGETAQVLEYWLDCSMWSHWKGRANAIKIPWDENVFLADLDFYGSRGICNITTFAVYVDAEYVEKYGEPPVDKYGRGLLDWRQK